ncbi:hypothetical protein D3C85_1621340 [compost metagenome]
MCSIGIEGSRNAFIRAQEAPDSSIAIDGTEIAGEGFQVADDHRLFLRKVVVVKLKESVMRFEQRDQVCHEVAIRGFVDTSLI